MRNKILILGIVSTLLFSCAEDFLTITSETGLSEDIYFKTQADIEAAVNGIYAPFRTLYTGSSATSEGANAAYLMAETHSDNARYILNPMFGATTNQEQVANFIHSPANSVSTFKYQYNFRAIGAANKVLAYVDDIEFDTDIAKNNAKGQALCLRAFAYFDLVQYFGSVPLHVEHVVNFEGTAVPLGSVDEIYALIVSDLNAAIGLLSTRGSGELTLGRVTQGTAQMILANVYMVRKDYASAESVLTDIITTGDYMLMDDYASIFDPVNKNNSESIFEIQYRQGTDGYSSTFCYGMLPYPMDRPTVAALTGVSDPNPLQMGEALCAPSPELIAAYEPGDLRFDATIDRTNTQDGVEYPFCKKYLHPHINLNNSNDNWPVYRYAEVLLFLAEAINEQGGANSIDNALHYINDVIGNSNVSLRGRAGLAPLAAATQQELRDAIAQERRVELAFENKRWLDLVRTGVAVDVITAYGQKIKANPQDYYTNGVPESAFSEIPLVWPLPASESQYTPYF